MDLVQHVYGTLAPLGYPATHHSRSGQFPCLSYHFFGERPSLHGDGKVKREECHCQIDIFTRDGMSYPIVRKVKKAMLDSGFLYVRTDDSYDSSPGLYHKVLVFYLEFETEDEISLRPSPYPAINANTGRYLINPKTGRLILLVREV